MSLKKSKMYYKKKKGPRVGLMVYVNRQDRGIRGELTLSKKLVELSKLLTNSSCINLPGEPQKDYKKSSQSDLRSKLPSSSAYISR